MAGDISATARSRGRKKTDEDLTPILSNVGLLLFTIGYYNRPEDFLGGSYLPLALIGGALAIVAYIFHLVSGGHVQRSRETKILLALLVWFILTVPFSSWKGGSFQLVKDNLSKILLLTTVMMNVVTTMSRMRKLLLVQIISVAVMGWTAHSNFDSTGRATSSSSSFGNSNDLAVILCVCLPLLLFFFLQSKYLLGKGLYAALTAIMLYTILMTFSRTGFLATAVALVVLVWHFGIKTGHYLRVVAGGILLAVVFLAFMPSGYGKMITSIYDNDAGVAGTARPDAADSKEARIQLLNRAVELTLKNPVFGVGLGRFEPLSGRWQVEHNTYLQFSTEAGLPALALFLILIYFTFLNLRNAERLSLPQSEIWRLAGALRASLCAFLVGAFFLNLGYLFFPYFIFGFAAAAHQIALGNSESFSLRECHGAP